MKLGEKLLGPATNILKDNFEKSTKQRGQRRRRQKNREPGQHLLLVLRGRGESELKTAFLITKSLVTKGR